MEIHKQYHMTEAEFLAHGARAYARNQFLNNPYMHTIAVATNNLDFCSMICHLSTKYNHPASSYAQICNNGSKAAGFTVTYPSRTMVVTVINLANILPGSGSINGFIQFMDTVAHEIQHALVKLLLQENVDIYNEQEPHAYSTGFITQNVLRIVQRETSMFTVSLPFSHATLIDSAVKMKNQVLSTLSEAQFHSCIMDEWYRTTHGVVKVYNDGWSSTSYTPHGDL